MPREPIGAITSPFRTMRLTHPLPTRPVTPPLPDSAPGKAPSAGQHTTNAPETLTGPLAGLAALKNPTGGLSDRLTTRRDAAAIAAAVVQGLPRSLDPDEGAALIHEAVAGHDEAGQARILASFAWQLRSLRALPDVRQDAIDSFLAAAEKIKTGRPPELDAAVIAFKAEHLGTLKQFRDLLDKAQVLPREHRRQAITAIGGNLFNVSATSDQRLHATRFFLEAAAGLETDPPALLESLVKAARAGRQGLLQRELNLLAAGGDLHARLLESLATARREDEGQEKPCPSKQELLAAGADLYAALSKSLDEPARNDEQELCRRERNMLGEGGYLHWALIDSLQEVARGRNGGRTRAERTLHAKCEPLYSALSRSLTRVKREGEQAFLQREHDLLAVGGELHTSLMRGRVSCREVAARHGIAVSRLHDLALDAAKSRVRGGENLVEILQTVDVDVDSDEWVDMTDIALKNAQLALHHGEQPSRAIERLGIHDPKSISELVQESVEKLRAEGVNTVPDIMQKLDFSDARYARLASKCVADLIG